MNEELLTYEIANTWWVGYMFNTKMRAWARSVMEKRVARKVKKYSRLCTVIDKISRSRGRAEAN